MVIKRGLSDRSARAAVPILLTPCSINSIIKL